MENKINALLQKMTLKEKIGQLNQIPFQQEYTEEILEKVRKGEVGSLILATTAHAGNEVQHVADVKTRDLAIRTSLEETRLGIPVILGRDVIHGHHTVFPIPLAQAATWNPELVKKGSEIAALEAAAEAIHWTFAPMLDISRDPRWGRIIESFGEDPCLSSVMAKATVEGFQGEDCSRYGKIAACAKHYIGYGASEGGRDYNSTEISPNTLFNIYMPPFKSAVDAGCRTVMTAFCENDGTPMTCDKELINGTLKNDFGFDGFVVTDWLSLDQLIHQRVAADKREASLLALDSGVDMDMLSECYIKELENLTKEYPEIEEKIDEGVRRILRVKFELGLFDDPYSHNEEKKGVLLSESHRQAAREAAAECCVLLKNDNHILPLKPDDRIGLVGPFAREKKSLMGSWTLDGDENQVISIEEGFGAVCPNLVTSQSSLTDDMIAAVRDCSTVVLALGESSQRSGEARSVADIRMQKEQVELIKTFKLLGKRVIALICAGRPLAIEEASVYADAILYCWHSGTESGNGIADIVFGKASPSGRLPVTLLKSSGQIPLYYNHKPNGRSIDEYFNDVEYRNYEDASGAPLYPFGFGLGYSEVSYSDLRLEGEEDGVKISVRLTNNGEFDVYETVQCYVSREKASVTLPVRQLAGFSRELVKARQSREAVMYIPDSALKFYNKKLEYVFEGGNMEFMVGKNCVDVLKERIFRCH